MQGPEISSFAISMEFTFENCKTSKESKRCAYHVQNAIKINLRKSLHTHYPDKTNYRYIYKKKIFAESFGLFPYFCYNKKNRNQQNW